MSIPEIFEDNCRKNPDTLALIYKNKKYTYKELNIKANLLANFLNNKYSIKSDTLILLFLDKNEHLIISILAVLKSGAAYVPFDVEYPDERIFCIIEDSKSQIILTNNQNKLKLENILNTRIKK